MLEDLSIEEQALLNHLGQAWNMMVALPELRQWEKFEFMTKIHDLQNMVLARPILSEMFPDYEDPVQGKELDVVKTKILKPGD